jgi:hypothetical protein
LKKIIITSLLGISLTACSLTNGLAPVGTAQSNDSSTKIESNNFNPASKAAAPVRVQKNLGMVIDLDKREVLPEQELGRRVMSTGNFVRVSLDSLTASGSVDLNNARFLLETPEYQTYVDLKLEDQDIEILKSNPHVVPAIQQVSAIDPEIYKKMTPEFRAEMNNRLGYNTQVTVSYDFGCALGALGWGGIGLTAFCTGLAGIGIAAGPAAWSQVVPVWLACMQRFVGWSAALNALTCIRVNP